MKTKRTIRNCVPEFKYQCPKDWESLDATDSESVRFCTMCHEKVYFCTSDEDTLKHAIAGHCIARELPDESELPGIVLGRPEKPVRITPEQEKASEWNTREHGIDQALEDIKVSNRSCPSCGYPVPDWRKSCKVCRLEIGRVNKNA